MKTYDLTKKNRHWNILKVQTYKKIKYEWIKYDYKIHIYWTFPTKLNLF